MICQNVFFVKISIFVRFTRVLGNTKFFILLVLALNNNHSLHYSFLFTKPYFLWFLNIFMMFTYLKLSMLVSSTGQNGQVKYYHLVFVVCYPQLFILIFNLFLRNCKTKCFNYFTLSSFGTVL